MGTTIKIVIGIVIIVVSFIYLVMNPGQSMMDGMMKKRKQQYDQAQAEPLAKQSEEESKDSTQI